MPYKSEKIKIEFTKHDKRIKLTEKQRQQILKEWQTGLISQRQLAKKYGVDKKTISNIIYPDKYKNQLEQYKINQHSKQYYSKEKQRIYIKNHRRYKQNLFVNSEINLENEVENGTK